MNRRITKTMADEAASKMKKKAYGRKIENATAKVNAAVEELVRKYIPAPVIACVNEYSTYFSYSTGASITTIVDKNGWTTSRTAIKGTLTFKIPGNANYIKVDNKEYEALLKLEEKRKSLEKQRDEFGDQVYEALIALKTEKAVEKELPEAMKYLVFPEVKAVPMPVFTGLRDIISSIKEQYFTPPSVASVTARTNIFGMDEPKGTPTPMGHRITISDPAGGSGRMALAGYCALLERMQRDWGHDAAWTEAHRPYISVEDLDYNCVKMAALNICLHSAYGEAVCHDTLTEPDTVRIGFIIGEADWPFPTGIPSVRKEMNPARFVCTRQWMQKRADREKSEQRQESGVSDSNNVAPETPLSDPVPQTKPKQQPQQLTLW